MALYSPQLNNYVVRSKKCTYIRQAVLRKRQYDSSWIRVLYRCYTLQSRNVCFICHLATFIEMNGALLMTCVHQLEYIQEYYIRFLQVKEAKSYMLLHKKMVYDTLLLANRFIHNHNMIYEIRQVMTGVLMDIA